MRVTLHHGDSQRSTHVHASTDGGMSGYCIGPVHLGHPGAGLRRSLTARTQRGAFTVPAAWFGASRTV